ncbi:hypothetical protein LCGC14_1703170 [marine sediment metagenome]|uniref:DNA methylase N-4/N-6 domain-containing protein n=1 Tax=marine sediment metagenome TaxID=412755 RepID=A0A0F9HHW5_9ZZZZ
MNLPINQIICGDALAELQKLPAESINCCISSPPYWALRDYGVDGQLGLEPTFEEYIDKLCTVYDEVKRVLRADGTCWVNLGDTYGTQSGNSRGKDYSGCPGTYMTNREAGSVLLKGNIQHKCLCLIPQRFTIEMVNRGWIMRNFCVWHKPNPMPSSAKDRFTVDWEPVFFFVKSKRYAFEPQYEPCLTESNAERPRMGQGQNTQYKQKRQDKFRNSSRYVNQGTTPNNSAHSGDVGVSQASNPLGRNKRTVWTIPTEARSEAHFATFPQRLVEPMIKAGCPKYVCIKCGKVRVKIWETEIKSSRYDRGSKSSNFGIKQDVVADHHFKGYTDCGCEAKYRPGIVLDPFMGSGTVARVAVRLGRDYIGIDLNKQYIEEIAEPFVAEAVTGISRKERKQGQMGLFE